MFRTACRALLFLLFSGIALPQSNLSGLSTQQLTLFNLLNGERAKAGLPKLGWDEHLAQSAGAHAQLMAQQRELSHQFPDEPKLGDRIGATGLRFNAAAENVAYAPTIEEAHSGLMHSPPHRANILDPKYNAVGFGIVQADGELYVTQNFAHVLPVYTEEQFRDEVIAAFNQLRKGARLTPIEAAPDTQLHTAACAGKSDANALIRQLPGVTNLVLFTASVPEKLSPDMKAAAADRAVRRMGIGVCFKPGAAHGYGSFWVVAAFYPGN